MSTYIAHAPIALTAKQIRCCYGMLEYGIANLLSIEPGTFLGLALGIKVIKTVNVHKTSSHFD